MEAEHPLNRSVWITTAVLGATIAMGGFHHGLFEALQGNAPTPGVFINSIGPHHVRWEHGTDPAFTIIPNFLVTGLAAMAVSVVVTLWAFTALRGPHGASGLLALFVLLTLVGGGVGHILFFVAVWAYATRLRRPVGRLSSRVPESVRRALSASWLPLLCSASALFLAGLEVSVFGMGSLVVDPDQLLLIDWSLLMAAFLCLNLAYLGAMMRDSVPLPDAGKP